MSKKNGRGNCEQGAVNPFEDVSDKFRDNLDYFERLLDARNRRANLHHGAACGSRARAEITGMLLVINALGFEAVGDWTRYDGEFELVLASELAKEGGAK